MHSGGHVQMPNLESRCMAQLQLKVVYGIVLNGAASRSGRENLSRGSLWSLVGCAPGKIWTRTMTM